MMPDQQTDMMAFINMTSSSNGLNYTGNYSYSLNKGINAESGPYVFYVLNFPENLAFPVYGILCPVITVLTLISNLLVVCVFMTKKMRSVTTVFLAGLACSDTLSAFLWSSVHLYFYGIEKDYTTPVSYPLCIFHDYALYLAVLFHATSVWLTMTLGIQRGIIVVKPFIGPRIWTIRKSVFITVMAYLLSVMFFLPLFFMKTYEPSNIKEGNTTITVCATGIHPWFVERVYTYSMVNYLFRSIFVQMVPCLSMLITTVLLSYKLKHEKILQRSVSGSHDGPKKDFQHRQRTTLMVIIIMIIFLVVEIPNGIVFGIKVYEELAGEMIIPTSIDYPIAILQNCILLLSYHCNFWIYVGLSARFRKTLKLMVCKFKVKQTFERVMTISSGSPTNAFTRKTAIRMHLSNGNSHYRRHSLSDTYVTKSY